MPNPQPQTIQELRQTIGENIHRTRKRRKVTLTKLSKQTNIPYQKLDGYEIGKYELCLVHLLPIANALSVDVKALLRKVNP
ncbi:MAG: helix-turn-helix domain-containing protein [Alphaproteobacteria bacterium]